MKKFPRHVVFLLCVLFLVASAAGCQQTIAPTTAPAPTTAAAIATPAPQTTAPTETPAPTATPMEQVTLKFVFPGDPIPDQDAVWGALNAISSKAIATSYSIEFVPWSDYGTKRNLYMQSGEEFDGTLVFVTELSQLWLKGGLTGLTDYISPEKTPNLLKAIDLQVFKDMAINGQYTCIPSVVSAQNWYISYITRADLREKYDMPKITTLEQLEQYFDNVKKNEPGMIPMNGYEDYNHLSRVLGNSAFVGPDYYFGGPAYVDPQNPDKVTNWIESDKFKQMCQIHRKWYEKGWQNPDILNPGTTPPTFADGKIACYTHDITVADSENIAPKIEGLKAETTILNPDKPGWRNMWANNLVCVPNTCKHPDRVCLWADWLYSDKSNYDLLLYGIKDTHYVLNNDEISVPASIDANKYPIWNQWYWAQGLLDYFTPGTSAETKERVKLFRDVNTPVEICPTLGLTMDMQPVNTEATKLDAAYKTYGVPLMAGVIPFEGNYEKLVQAYKDAGVDTFIAEAQRQYDAWRATRK